MFIDKYSLTFLFPAGWDNSVVVKLLKAKYKIRSQLPSFLWDCTIKLPQETVYRRPKIVSWRKLTIQTEDNTAITYDIRAPEKGEDVDTLAEGSPDLRVDAKNEFNVFDIFKAPDKVEDNMRLVGERKPALVRGNDEVNVTEIFKTLEKGEDGMTLLLGSPGMGKTAFHFKGARDAVLEKTFERHLRALGELAWLCLLSDRYVFPENELEEFEKRYPGLGNSSLNYIELRVHGELPGNWHSVVENRRLAKKFPVGCSINPKTFDNVANIFLLPVVVRKGLNLKQHLTVNVWGEMKCEAEEALCEVLPPSFITFVISDMCGNLTSQVADSIARCLEGNQTLSVLSINIWGELTTEGGSVLSRLSKENLSVQLNENDVRIGPDESNDGLDMAMDNPAAFRAVFNSVKERRKEKVSLTFTHNGYDTEEWTRRLGDALAENTSLTSLDLTVNSCSLDADLWKKLWKSLLQCTSLTSLSLTVNNSNMEEGWLPNLLDSLDKMASC